MIKKEAILIIAGVFAGISMIFVPPDIQYFSYIDYTVLGILFTTDARQLLLGVNIGGLGTPVASLASLISFRLYSKSEGSMFGKFLGVFTVYSTSILLLLSAMFLL